ncbi:acyl-CoA desaturase [Polynucleobacter sp. MWH-Loch1C5]|mgnify:CR=1 FL=1|jgi:stearoyl-CoA desaturase (delta-9 desaturase)|uniref:DesA family fatty acid desaturase n=1 Tax=Polynucleobacter sp. MWH-Loch1C5 TaxID=2689108 RepID=UPI001C0BF686|nr:acyl-CoA desaturase [Polynucleobacter sp. MWH-Loch1C5]MBU3542780.1 acyl-CoA desaturase [Polynucleobacter sp. MWH-Loch1C5]
MASLEVFRDHFLNGLANGYLDLAWWQIIVVTLVLTHITIASVTIFLHRCQAHRALDLHPLPSHFFRFWLWLTTGMVTKEWAAIHRKHHAKCETADDPHSPQVLGIQTVLSRGAELYRAEAKNRETIEKYGHGTPDDWVERNVYSKYQWQGVGLMLIIDLFLFGAIGATVWAVQMLWIPITAAGIINGIGHYWGYRNYECEDASTNILPWGILIGGEELHNNHHTYATSAKLSNKWYEFDIGWGYIRALEMMGLAKVKKTPPKPVLADVRQACELTLQAVIANRYEVMSRYSKALRKTLDHELTHMRELAGRFSGAHTWLQKDESKLSSDEKARLQDLMDQSKAVRLMIEMRRELTALWGRSNVTKEQLIVQLQDWCQRAEASGMQALQDFSLRLRRYTLKPA